MRSRQSETKAPVRPAATQVAEHASCIARRERQPAILELSKKVGALRSASGYGLGARMAAGALGAGFFLAGGVAARMRLLARGRREGTTKAKVGPFSLVDRDD